MLLGKGRRPLDPLLGGAAFAQEAARLVAQLFQLVGKVEIHGSFHPTQISVARG